MVDQDCVLFIFECTNIKVEHSDKLITLKSGKLRKQKEERTHLPCMGL